MIDRPLIVHIVLSATVIVVGTLCVFYAEVSPFRLRFSRLTGESV